MRIPLYHSTVLLLRRRRRRQIRGEERHRVFLRAVCKLPVSIHKPGKAVSTKVCYFTYYGTVQSYSTWNQLYASGLGLCLVKKGWHLLTNRLSPNSQAVSLQCYHVPRYFSQGTPHEFESKVRCQVTNYML